jgi:hypothetical protein
MITVRLPNDTTTKIQRDWTDIDGPSFSKELDNESVFTVESLRELCHLVSAFLGRT